MGPAAVGIAYHLLHREAVSELEPRIDRVLGTVILYLDYQVPLGELRKELKRLVENNPKWTGECVAYKSPTRRKAQSKCARWSAAPIRAGRSISAAKCAKV